MRSRIKFGFFLFFLKYFKATFLLLKFLVDIWQQPPRIFLPFLKLMQIMPKTQEEMLSILLSPPFVSTIILSSGDGQILRTK